MSARAGPTTTSRLRKRGALMLSPRPDFIPPADLLLVPGLAFDGEGHRLGYGRGFYDALLDRLDGRLPVLGVGFACQRVSRLPRDPQDLPVQGLVTEQGFAWFGPTGEEP